MPEKIMPSSTVSLLRPARFSDEINPENISHAVRLIDPSIHYQFMTGVISVFF